MKLKDLTEAPIGDYATLGRWGDEPGGRSFRHEKDRRLIQNPQAIEKVRQKFGNTDHVLNFYFIDHPQVTKNAERGYMSPDELKAEMPAAWELVQQREQQEGTDPSKAINVLFVGNAGVNRVAMTPWIMAHRIGHAMQSSAPRVARYQQGKNNAWKEFEEDFMGTIRKIVEDVYGWRLDSYPFGDKLLAKFFEVIGTMNSARKGNLGGRPYEFLYELFAQYVTTGSLKFRELPKAFGIRNGAGYRVRDEDMWEYWNEIADQDAGYNIVNQWEERLDNVLYDAEGKYLVM